MNICEHLTSTAKLHPDQTALWFDNTTWTYRQIDQLSAAAADRLRQAGVEPGDRVALMLPNTPSFVVWYYAVLRRGAIAVAISTRLVDREVDFVIEDCEAQFFIGPELVGDRHLPHVVQHRFAVSDDASQCNGNALLPATSPRQPDYNARPDEPALILYTSGTTGFAKGATLSHQNVRSTVHAFNHLCGQQVGDVILLAVPLFHCFGQNALLNSGFNAGATLVLQPTFDPSVSKRLIAQHAVTQLYGVPAMFQLLMEQCSPSDLESVNYCFTAAATMPVQIADQWLKKFHLPLYEGYGLTETAPFASYNHRSKFVPGSIGTPVDLVEMKIVDTETGQDCPPGKLGEIAIRGPNVMIGYWNRPEDTQRAIRDGWFYSGDIGRMDENGFFYIVDRVKDMISVGGLKVFPAEVERVLLDLDVVSQVAVVGFANRVLGEEIAAFIVTGSTAPNDADQNGTIDVVKTYAREHLANYKIPKHIFIVDSLPRNASGKILKTELREMQSSLIADVTPSLADDPTNAITIEHSQAQPARLRSMLQQAYPSQHLSIAQSYLQDIIQAILGDAKVPEIGDRLLESGLDSLMLVELTHQLQLEIGGDNSLSSTVVFDYPTIQSLAKMLVAKFGEERSPAEKRLPAGNPDLGTGHDVAAMSEAEVLDELLRELED